MKELRLEEVIWGERGPLKMWLERFPPGACQTSRRAWGHSLASFFPSGCPSGEVATSAGPVGGPCTTQKRCSATGEASTAAASCAVSSSRCSTSDGTHMS